MQASVEERTRPNVGKAAPRLFVYAFCASSILILFFGWYSGLRETANVAMGSVLSIAFLPFVVILALATLAMLLVMCAGIAALITGDVGGAVAIELAGEAGIEAASTEGLGTVPAYYRWLFSIRHPLVWGALAGTFLGALVLFGLIAILITPGEMRTAEILAQAQTNIEQIYSDTGDYPPANGRGGIDLAGVEVLDGFGRPVKYTFSGKWKLKSYTLTSLGYDGTSGGDDLEVSGSMKLARFVKAFKSGTDGVNEMYEIINEMKKKK